MCTNNYTLKILNFQDKNIKLNKIEFINNTYYISVEQSKDSSLCCPQCGRTKITNNFYYIRLIKHFPINGFPTIILFKQIWFKCRYCNKTFNQPTSFINKGCNLSNQIKENILNESKYKQSFKDVSIRTNVSQTTVSNEFKKNIHSYRCHLSRIICIDEFKVSTIAGKYALIIGDSESGEILDILPSRLQDYIYHYFNTVDKSGRLNVEFVVTDILSLIERFVRIFFGIAFI